MKRAHTFGLHISDSVQSSEIAAVKKVIVSQRAWVAALLDLMVSHIHICIAAVWCSESIIFTGFRERGHKYPEGVA